MKTTEIPSEDWQKFCEKFTQFNRSSLLTIEVIGSDGLRSDVARELPLHKMVFETSDPCNDIISINLGTNSDQRKLNHLVIDPIYLRIRQINDGRKMLEIGSETGTNLVTFHSGRFPPMNDLINGSLTQITP